MTFGVFGICQMPRNRRLTPLALRFGGYSATVKIYVPLLLRGKSDVR